MSSNLVIEDAKLTRYLLIYQRKDDKSKYLAQYGYTLDNWQVLKLDIIKAVQGQEIDEITQTDWGQRFKVKSQWTGVNGKLIKVITIWQQSEGEDTIKLITLYPDKSEEN
ncbi:hypothetical protein CY0110_26233 [Crocosphaera chwakensis CCY0110]|uniref:DUF6883 domain-containing protein n=2 Tax=Crocosphaera TaxID=263510 RepID=A3IPD1_9CHRO|nr:hypothetical protein CY0110_26233 [Crocosphaera chwakensis CCY0110]